MLPLALTSRAVVHTFEGELAAAASLAAEAETITKATGSQLAPYSALGVFAWQGREAKVEALSEAMTEQVLARGEGIGLTVVEWARAGIHSSTEASCGCDCDICRGETAG